MKHAQGTLMGLMLLLVGATVAFAVPSEVTLQGTLTGESGTLAGTRAWRVQFYDAETDGIALGEELTGFLTVAETGHWSLSFTPPPGVVSMPGELWYELAIDSAVPSDGSIDAADVFPDRVQVQSVLFAQVAVNAEMALTANNATSLDGLMADDYATDSELDAALADKADIVHNHDAQYYTEAEVDAALVGKADATHTHELSGLVGQVTDGQVSNTLTLDALSSIDATALTSGTVSSARLSLTDDDIPDDITAANYLPRVADQYVVVQVSTGMTDLQRAAALFAAYTAAEGMSPAADNRIAVIVPPGRYDLDKDPLVLDTAYIDLIGLTSDRAAQYIYGLSEGDNSGVITQSADNVRIENLTVECTRSSGGLVNVDSDPAAYFPADNLLNTVVRNCTFIGDETNSWSMRIGIEYSGTFEDCTAGENSFGWQGEASGTFTACAGDEYAFGGSGTASGTFTDCTSGGYGFAGHGTASGNFYRCRGGSYSFGGNATGTASGSFYDCTGSTGSFGGYMGTASGNFYRCEGSNYAFGGRGTASGCFRQCTAGTYSFGGGSGGAAGGSFYHCMGYSYSLGGTVDSNGYFFFCTGGTGSLNDGTSTRRYCDRNGVAVND